MTAKALTAKALTAKALAAKAAAPRGAPAPVKRSPGRPRKTDVGNARNPALSPEVIIETAFSLCREVPLADLSIVQLAKALDVVPATLHYYLDGRDAMLAGVISRYFEKLLPCFEIGRGQPWERRVRAVARALYDQQVRYHGVNSYFIAHNRFRLIQSDAPGAGDNGVRFLEAALRLFLEKPFSVRCAVANSHALVRFLCSSAHSASERQLPGQHRRFIREQLSRTDPVEFAAVHEALDEFVDLGADEAFETGLSILIRGFLDDSR
ncbi:MAG: TetR/AcrR family transcriptional regulator [Burkholderiaceae bacterium]